MSTPLVRTPDGAVLGIDWRRIGGLVPGMIAAKHLCPGDRVLASGATVVVQGLPSSSPARRGAVSVQTLTPAGAPVVMERDADELVQVLAAGEFDR